MNASVATRCAWWLALGGLILASAGGPSSAQAQTATLAQGGMDVRLFRSAVDSKGHLSVDGTDILGHKDYSFGLIMDVGLGILPFDGFQHRSTPSVDPADFPDGFRETDYIIDTAITGVLQFNYGLGNRLVLGAQLPIQIINGSNVVVPGFYNDGGRSPQGLAYQGLGDLQLHAKLRLLRRERDPIGLAAILRVGLPTGTSESFAGEPGISLWPSLVAEWMPVSILRFGANVGYRLSAGSGTRFPFRGATSSLDVTGAEPAPYCAAGPNSPVGSATCPQLVAGAGDQVRFGNIITFGGAVSLRLAKAIDLIGEVYGGQVGTRFGETGTLGVEALGGLKVFVERNSYLVLGAGGSLVQSMNSADKRLVLGFIFEPSIGDRDGDGYKDDVDQCPDEPEDFDGFEDADGCPDPDNDRDGILDVDDECPNIPEDFDGDADEDGCPEGDLGDRDGDGILDNVDRCPDDPEDFDGFQDEDGCPDPDNDGDGILDGDDLCPNDPEDFDGFEDADGCPDPDNDRDRILDVDDACPNDPENYNGFQDEDGCPDQGSVLIEDNQIIILEKIYFATDSAEILPRSFPIVDAVAATLKGNPHITKVEVQGHADERGSDAYNVRLTGDRAASVVEAIVSRGVDRNRLRSGGYGERCPVDPRSNAEAWEKNRRVEFKIIRTDMGPTGVEIACPAGRDLIPE